MTTIADAPARMLELWQWVGAVCAFDYGDPQPLADLLRSGDPIPAEFRGAIADIVAGVRKPNRKAGAKLKTPAAKRMSIASTVDLLLSMMRAQRANSEAMGDFNAMEPIDIVRGLEEQMRRVYQGTADYLGVSVETVEEIVRDMRARVARWPVV